MDTKDISQMVTCPIHLDKLKDPIVLQCQHAFCRNCISEWARRSPQCPTCRKPINYQLNDLSTLPASLLHKELVDNLNKISRNNQRASAYNIDVPDRNALKISLVGNSKAGKTSLVRNWCGLPFSVLPVATIGSDVNTINVYDGQQQLRKIFLWDTAGQDVFRTIIRSHYVKSNGIIVVFDVTDEQSFIDIETWLEEIKTHINNNEVIILLIANKIDLPRIVSSERASQCANRLNLLYAETSAKTGENVMETIQLLVNRINTSVHVNNLDIQRVSSSTIQLRAEPEPTTSSCMC